jgi:hypothetical protein
MSAWAPSSSGASPIPDFSNGVLYRPYEVVTDAGSQG